MKKRAIVIFSGFNQRAVIAFLRVVSRNNVPFGIIAKSDSDSILLTQYKKDVISIREFVSLDLKDLLHNIDIVKQKLKVNELIIAPSTEALNRFILKNRLIFSQANCLIPLVKENLYNQISDKYTFSRLCEKNRIKVPMEINNLHNTSLPFVAKPKSYYSKNTKDTLSPVIINSEKQKSDFIEKYCVSEFYFQEFIGGKSKYLLYYFHSDGSVYKFSQENLIQQPNGKSMVAAISSDFHVTSESTKYEKLFNDIEFTGFVMIEVKGDNFMIEANPRFWGPSQLFVDAKVNLFEAFLHDYNFITNKPPLVDSTLKDVIYFWYGGIIQTLVNNSKLDFHNYDAENLVQNYPSLLSSDIYRRKDTYEIFKKEINI